LYSLWKALAMTSFWKGMFAPPMQKTVDDVSYVALPQMTADDWRYIDYTNLNEVAKNRITEAIFDGELVGFFDVRVTNKAAKPRYLWPARLAQVTRMRINRGPVGHAFFRNETGGAGAVEVESAQTTLISDAISTVAASPFATTIVAKLVKDATDKGDGTICDDISREFPEWDTPEKAAKYLESLDNRDTVLAAVSLYAMCHSQDATEELVRDLGLTGL